MWQAIWGKSCFANTLIPVDEIVMQPHTILKLFFITSSSTFVFGQQSAWFICHHFHHLVSFILSMFIIAKFIAFLPIPYSLMYYSSNLILSCFICYNVFFVDLIFNYFLQYFWRVQTFIYVLRWSLSPHENFEFSNKYVLMLI